MYPGISASLPPHARICPYAAVCKDYGGNALVILIDIRYPYGWSGLAPKRVILMNIVGLRSR